MARAAACHDGSRAFRAGPTIDKIVEVGGRNSRGETAWLLTCVRRSMVAGLGLEDVRGSRSPTRSELRNEKMRSTASCANCVPT
jgi:hypothetical protein